MAERWVYILFEVDPSNDGFSFYLFVEKIIGGIIYAKLQRGMWQRRMCLV